jgi:muconolactone delta-isomerase
MEDKDYYAESPFNLDNMKEPDDEAAEAMLKRLAAQEQSKANRSFKEGLGAKVWRTRDGRYVDFEKMDDNHLMNSYNLVERNIKTSLNSTITHEGEADIVLQCIINDKPFDAGLKRGLGEQIKGYKFLHDEIMKRNLFGRKLEQATEEVFDIFESIINSKPEEDETQ